MPRLPSREGEAHELGLGQSVFVADVGNRAIRRLDRWASGWVVSVVVFNLPGSPDAITSDGVGNLYFTLGDIVGANSGVYRLSLGGSTATRVYSNSGLNFFATSLRWDGGGGLILGLGPNDALYRLTPTIDPDTWQGVKLAGTGGLGSVGGGMRAKDAPIVSPRGLAIDRSGTLYVSSYGGHQVLKLDLRR